MRILADYYSSFRGMPRNTLIYLTSGVSKSHSALTSGAPGSSDSQPKAIPASKERSTLKRGRGLPCLVPSLVVLAMAVAQRLYFAWSFGFSLDARTTRSLISSSLLEVTPLLAVTGFFAYMWSRTRLARWAIFLIYAFLTALILVDTVYFAQTQLRMDRVLLVNLNLYSAGGFMTSQVYLTAVGFILFYSAVLWFGIRSVKRCTTGPSAAPSRAVYLVALISIAILVWIEAATYQPLTEHSVSYDSLDAVENRQRNLHLAVLRSTSWGNLVHLGKSIQMLEGVTPPVEFTEYGPSEVEELQQLGFTVPLHSGKTDPSTGERSFDRILVVILESVPLEYLPSYTENVPPWVMPFTTSLTRNHFSLTNYWTSNLPTDEGLYSMFLSRPAFDPGTAEANNLESLFSILRNNGFETRFIRAVSGYYGNHRWKYRQWFRLDDFVGAETLIEQYGSLARGGWGVDDCTVMREMIRLAGQDRSKPIFVVGKTIDTHYPYTSRLLPYIDRVAYDRNPLYRALKTFDQCLGEFFEDLKRRRLFDRRTVVIVTSDHSPNHGPFRRYTSAVDSRPARLPLILVARDSRTRIDLDATALTSQLDFAPTILNLTGIPIPGYWWGDSFARQSSRGIAISYEASSLLFRTSRGIYTIPYDNPLQNCQGCGPTERALATWVHNMNSSQVLHGR